ncbi:MAG: hypothetical protein ACR2P2_19760 [Nakamurella sp.]
MKRTRLTAALAVAALAVTGLVACGSGSSGGGDSSATKTLVIDNTFDLKTSDPARAFEFTGFTVDNAVYESALTFTGTDVKKVQPSICSYTISKDNRVVTLKMNGKHAFPTARR